jgi:hypothetical protein
MCVPIRIKIAGGVRRVELAGHRPGDRLSKSLRRLLYWVRPGYRHQEGRKHPPPVLTNPLISDWAS